jgi:hypothetical protein
MKRFSIALALAWLCLLPEVGFGRTITGFHLAPASAVTPVTTSAPNNDNPTSASPNSITLPANGSLAAPFNATTFDPIDFVFDVQGSGGNTEYFVTTYVLNNTGAPWGGFRLQLGSGFGANFMPIGATIPEIQPPDFDAPNFDPDLTNSAFSTVSLNSIQITFSGAPLAPPTVMTATFSIDTPDDMFPGGYTNFTVRQLPLAVPEPGAFSLFALAAIGLVVLRARANQAFRVAIMNHAFGPPSLNEPPVKRGLRPNLVGAIESIFQPFANAFCKSALLMRRGPNSPDSASLKHMRSKRPPSLSTCDKPAT